MTDTTPSTEQTVKPAKTLQDYASQLCLLLFCLYTFYAFFAVIFRFPQRFSKYHNLTFCGAFILFSFHHILRRDQTPRSRILWSIMAGVQATLFLKILFEILH